MNDVIGYLIAGVSIANTVGLLLFARRTFERLDSMRVGVTQVEHKLAGAVAQRSGIEIDAFTAKRLSETNRDRIEHLELFATRQDPSWDRR